MRVFVTRPIPRAALDRLRQLPDVDVFAGPAPPPPDVLRARAAPAEGVLCQLTDRIDAGFFDACPKLRVVSTMAVGVDNVDLDAATARGIRVGHTPDVLTETTADLTWALILGVARRITEAERYLRQGRWTVWSYDLLVGRDVHGATLGIIGMGAIGQAVARRASGFGMRVLYAARSDKPVTNATRVDLDRLLRESDFVSLHCALTADTAGLIGQRELRRMKQTAYIVNAARGGLVDEDALVRALREGWIAGAGLDVYRTEPLPSDSPLLELDNVVLVPHIGSASVATRERMAHLAVDNLLAGLEGQPLPHQANKIS